MEPVCKLFVFSIYLLDCPHLLEQHNINTHVSSRGQDLLGDGTLLRHWWQPFTRLPGQLLGRVAKSLHLLSQIFRSAKNLLFQGFFFTHTNVTGEEGAADKGAEAKCLEERWFEWRGQAERLELGWCHQVSSLFSFKSPDCGGKSYSSETYPLFCFRHLHQTGGAADAE